MTKTKIKKVLNINKIKSNQSCISSIKINNSVFKNNLSYLCCIQHKNKINRNLYLNNSNNKGDYIYGIE